MQISRTDRHPVSSLDSLRLGTEADRRVRLAGTVADAAKRAVELMAAVNTQNPATLALSLDRLERGVRAVRSCVDDLAAAPPDAEVHEYRASVMTSPPVEYAAARQYVPGIGWDRRVATRDRREVRDDDAALAKGFLRKFARRQSDRDAIVSVP